MIHNQLMTFDFLEKKLLKKLQKKIKKDVENDNLETCMLSSEADFHALGFPYSSAGCFSGRRRGHLDSR